MQQKSSGRILGLIEKIREGERRAVSENQLTEKLFLIKGTVGVQDV